MMHDAGASWRWLRVAAGFTLLAGAVVGCADSVPVPEPPTRASLLPWNSSTLAAADNVLMKVQPAEAVRAHSALLDTLRGANGEPFRLSHDKFPLAMVRLTGGDLALAAWGDTAVHLFDSRGQGYGPPVSPTADKLVFTRIVAMCSVSNDTVLVVDRDGRRATVFDAKRSQISMQSDLDPPFSTVLGCGPRASAVGIARRPPPKESRTKRSESGPTRLTSVVIRGRTAHQYFFDSVYSTLPKLRTYDPTEPPLAVPFAPLLSAGATRTGFLIGDAHNRILEVDTALRVLRVHTVDPAGRELSLSERQQIVDSIIAPYKEESQKLLRGDLLDDGMMPRIVPAFRRLVTAGSVRLLEQHRTPDDSAAAWLWFDGPSRDTRLIVLPSGHQFTAALGDTLALRMQMAEGDQQWWTVALYRYRAGGGPGS